MTSTGASGRVPERAWFKSSYSNPNGNQCVEVCFEAGLVHVRDSKDRGAGPVLTVSGEHWAAFLESVAGRAPAEPGAALQITAHAGGGASLTTPASPGVTLTYTPDEWTAFAAGVRNSEFDNPSEKQLAA